MTTSPPAFLFRCLLPLLIVVSVTASSGPDETASKKESGENTEKRLAIDTRSIRGKDQVEISDEEGVTYVDIRLKDGIGSARVTLKKGAWPENMAIRVYSSMLEKIAFESSSGKKVEGFFATSMNPKTGERKHKFHSEQEIEAKGAESSKDEGGHHYFLLKIPEGFFDEKASWLKVEWIDAYR